MRYVRFIHFALFRIYFAFFISASAQVPGIQWFTNGAPRERLTEEFA
jgi:hypothetical protein